MAGLTDPKTCIEFNGFFYATLDFTSPTCSTIGMQLAYIKVPEGWDLARFSEVVVANVIAKYPWGTNVLVLHDGSAYWTSAYSAQAGTKYGTGWLQWEGHACKPTQGSLRVLICSQGHSKPSAYCLALATGVWDQKLFTDCEVFCDDDVTPCHRALLAYASPVMANMLSSDMTEAQQHRIVLKDAEPGTVKSMLKFMYFGAVTRGEIDVELLRLADMYQVAPLVNVCLDCLLKDINADNALSLVRTMRSLQTSPEVQAGFEKLSDKLQEDRALLQIILHHGA